MSHSGDWVKIPGKLLVVDDDFIVRQLARAVLEKAGCTVYESADGASALEEFVLHKPDIVLLDVLMPGKSGFEICTEIRSLPGGSDVPIVIMTGLDDADSLLTAYRLGATDFITKPINWEALPYRMQYIFRSGQALRDLRHNEQKLNHAQMLASMGNWEWNPSLDEFKLSPSCHDILGVESLEGINTLGSFTELIHEEERDSVREALFALVEHGQPLNIDCRVVARDGIVRYCHLGAENDRDPSGLIVSVAGTIQDITERKRVEEKIRYLAYYDSLTGLPNRTLFKEHLKRTLAVARQLKETVAILFIDLDRFKNVNDSLGHDAGDQLLREAAERMQRYVRKYDTLSRCSDDLDKPVVSRLGGDEFTILLEGINSPETAAVIARRVIDTLEPPFVISGKEIFISASIGISVYPDDSSDADSLVKFADIAMYAAKDLGRGTFQYYRREMNEASMRRVLVEKHLRRALENNSLTIVYQPQIDCESQQLVGLEATLRWDNSELGTITPEEFMSVAEETGLVVMLDRWAIDSVAKQVIQWLRGGVCPGFITISISPGHFQKKNLPSFTGLVLELPEEMRRRLVIEIGEKCLGENVDKVADTLEQLVASGVHVSLDNFGTGHTSLDDLTRIPCHFLKIAKSFVDRIDSPRSSMAAVNGIIALAKSLDLKVIAKGVETADQLEFLRGKGCRAIQGNLYQRPLPAEALLNLLSVNRIALPGHAAGPSSPQQPVSKS